MKSDETLAKLLDALWTQYKARVGYVQQYEKMVLERGGRAINDHIAFRTLDCNVGGQPAGVEAIARIFVPLGYEQKDKYLFEDKNLTAWHYEHKTNPDNPKLFISQLEVDELSPPIVKLIKDTVKDAPDLLTEETLCKLKKLGKGEEVPEGAMIKNLARFFSRPWAPPKRSAIEPVNRESQYGAWVLLHGNAVDHFTAYINKQNVSEWPDLETTVNALRKAGLPMKNELEGEAGSKLRQSSTQAAEMDCDVTEDNGHIGKLKWSYAYYELAERGMVPGPGGKPTLFQAFLGAQATNLFDMTKRE